MHSKWEAIKGSAGFFATMAICLVVVGVSGYYLLTENQEEVQEAAIVSTPDNLQAEEPPTEPVSQTAETQEVVSVEEDPTVAVLAEDTIPPAPMPEAEVDVIAPVEAEAPQVTVSPVSGEVVMAFSADQLVYNPVMEDWRVHDGVDLSAPVGSSVLAACAGTVYSVTEDPTMGVSVVLSHQEGYQTTYANLQPEVAVEIGDAVSAGQAIGAVGETAVAEASQQPHLHFSVSKDGEAIDPAAFLEK